MRRSVAMLSAAVSLASVCCSFVVDTTGLAGIAPDGGPIDASVTDAGAVAMDAGAGEAASVVDGRALPPGTVVWSENGHGYLVVAQPGDWTSAKQRATDLGGHLVTIGSATENEFVYSLTIAKPGAWTTTNHGPWIGAVQPAGSPEPAGGWKWVTGEPFTYTSWLTGEPSNSDGVESVAHYYAWADGTRGPTWNDNSESQTYIPGFVVEFE